MDFIKAEMRNLVAKAKQLRNAGITPCVISGAGLEDSISIQIDQKTARQLKHIKQTGSKVDIHIGEKLYHTLIKEMEYNSLNDTIVHISFHVLDNGKKVNSVADIVLKNKDVVQGVLEQMQMKVPHAATPENLLDVVTLDLTDVPVGTTVTIKDIPEFQSDKIELHIDPDSIVYRVREKRLANTHRMEE